MNQKAVTMISMILVIFGAVMVNEFVLKSGSADQDRALASFGERFEPNQIKWEQELANTISKDPNAKTVLGTKPNSQDRLMFEVFEGRYEAQLNEGKIYKIAVLPNQAPIELNTEDFMNEYSDMLKQGQLSVQRDDKGRVISIEIQ